MTDFYSEGIEKARILPPFLLQDVADLPLLRHLRSYAAVEGATAGRQPMLARSRVAGQDGAAGGCCLLQFASRH